MDCLEVVSELFEAVRILSGIVDKQAEIIEQAHIEDAVVRDLRLLREEADNLYRDAMKEECYISSKNGGE